MKRRDFNFKCQLFKCTASLLHGFVRTSVRIYAFYIHQLMVTHYPHYNPLVSILPRIVNDMYEPF